MRAAWRRKRSGMSHPLVMLRACPRCNCIDRITRLQYALITRAQALAAGLTDGQIRGPAPQWHVDRDPSVGLRDRRRAAVLAPDASRERARARLRVVGVARNREPPVGAKGVRPARRARARRRHLGTQLRLDGVRGRRSGALFDSDLTVRHGIPTVTAERALIDVSSRLTAESTRPRARRRHSAEDHRPRGVPTLRRAVAPGSRPIDVEGSRRARRPDPRLRPWRQ